MRVLKCAAKARYTMQADGEIDILKGDICLVKLPLRSDWESEWVQGWNERTREFGDLPGTYMRAIEEIEINENEWIRPPALNVPQSAQGHSFVESRETQPLWCDICEDFMWGCNAQGYQCTGCGAYCHRQCIGGKSAVDCDPALVNPRAQSSHQSILDWDMEDVQKWLAAANMYEYCDLFRQYEVDGKILLKITESQLFDYGLHDDFHRNAILKACQELCYGNTETHDNKLFSGFSTHGENSHESHSFKVHSFSSLHWCDKCGKLLWGLLRQGLMCSVCGYICHRMCKRDNIPQCPGGTIRIRNNNQAPMFGVEIGRRFRPDKQHAPAIVMKCVQSVEARGKTSEGIYKVSPRGSARTMLRTALSQSVENVDMKDPEWGEPYCAAGVLKTYLLELPTPLITFDLYDSFIKAANIENEEDAAQSLAQVFDRLPETNKKVLEYLMAHLLLICRNETWTRMSKRELAAVFAPILLRPTQENILNIVYNHEQQIRVVELLISKKHKEIKESSVPPPIPVRKGRKSTMVKQPSVDAPWYWPHVGRNLLTAKLQGQPDGTFLVRDAARNQGGYTLMLRKGGTTRLIRIMHENGKYGFSEPLTFNSMIEVVEHYQEHSLSQYNPNLDVRLSHPISKFDNEEEVEAPSTDHEHVVEKLMNVHQEIKVNSDTYEKKFQEHTQLGQEISECEQAIDAQKAVLQLIEQQMDIHKIFQREAPPTQREELRMNFEMLNQRFSEAQQVLDETEKELQLKTNRNRQIDTSLNELKPKLRKLEKSQEQYILWLNQSGINQDYIQHKLNQTEQDQYIYAVEPNKFEGQEDDLNEDLTNKEWYMGKLTKEEIPECLNGTPQGTFLIRDSIHNDGYSISIMYNGDIKHIRIHKGPHGYGFAQGHYIYPTLASLVDHYQHVSLSIHNDALQTTLKYPVRLVNRALAR